MTEDDAVDELALEVAQRLVQARKAAGYKTAAQFCDTHGYKRPTYSMHESGKRRLKPGIARDYAEKLGVTEVWLLHGAGQGPKGTDGLEVVETPFIELEIRGEVQAGMFRDAIELPVDEWEIVHVPRPPGRHTAHFGLKVRGTSMNLEYPEGTILVCVPILHYQADVRPGDHVIVQRRARADDGVEGTVKELRLDEQGRYWLWPKSSDPEHQTPYLWPQGQAEDCAGGDEIKVIAIVVADYRVRPAGRRA